MDELIERLVEEARYKARMLQRMGSDGHGYFAQDDIGRLYKAADTLASLAAALRASAEREKRLKEALQKIAFGPPHEGEVKHVLNTLVEIAQAALKEVVE